MTPTKRYCCQACGQTWEISKVTNFTAAPPRFCPACGCGVLEETASSYGALKIATFKIADPMLVQLLFEQWATDPASQITEPYFLGFLKNTLAGATEEA